MTVVVCWCPFWPALVFHGMAHEQSNRHFSGGSIGSLFSCVVSPTSGALEPGAPSRARDCAPAMIRGGGRGARRLPN